MAILIKFYINFCFCFSINFNNRTFHVTFAFLQQKIESEFEVTGTILGESVNDKGHASLIFGKKKIFFCLLYILKFCFFFILLSF